MPSSLNVGLVGIRTAEIDTLVPALQAQKRFVIATIYDSCYHAARELSAPLKAKPAASLTQMLAKNDLQGVIVLNSSWQRSQPIFMSCLYQIPTLFVPQPEQSDPFVADQLLKLSNDQRTLLMPAYTHRWSPAVLRIQELSATCLGPVETITLYTASFETNRLTRHLDWSWNLIQSVPVQVFAGETTQIDLMFHRKQSDHTPVKASFILSEEKHALAILTFRNGTLTFHDDQHLTWSNGAEEHQEELSSDRSSQSVMLDLFGRRLSGGLVPVPILEDVVRNQAICEKIMLSRQSGQVEQFQG